MSKLAYTKDGQIKRVRPTSEALIRVIEADGWTLADEPKPTRGKATKGEGE